MTTVSWQRKNSIVSLPRRSLELVKSYHELLLSSSQDHSSTTISNDEILERAQRVLAASTSTASSNSDDGDGGGGAEYRCLETGGFLLPTVCHHPCYKSKSWRDSAKAAAAASDRFAVLDLGCGLGADGRHMLVDGFATHVVGVDRSDVYLRLGCQLFGDDPGTVVVRREDAEERELHHATSSGEQPVGQHSFVTFVAADVAAEQQQNDDEEEVDPIVSTIQWALQNQMKINDTAPFLPSKPQPLLNAVYAGKFFHCLETERNFRIVLRRVWKLLSSEGGCLFGVYGRNYRPPFECASKAAFAKALAKEGFSLSLIEEEAAGATWFCAFKQNKLRK